MPPPPHLKKYPFFQFTTLCVCTFYSLLTLFYDFQCFAVWFEGGNRVKLANWQNEHEGMILILIV